MDEKEHAEKIGMMRRQYEGRLAQWREQYEVQQKRHLEERDELRTDVEWWQRQLSRSIGLLSAWGGVTGILAVHYRSWSLGIMAASEILFSLYMLIRVFRRLSR